MSDDREPQVPKYPPAAIGESQTPEFSFWWDDVTPFRCHMAGPNATPTARPGPSSRSKPPEDEDALAVHLPEAMHPVGHPAFPWRLGVYAGGGRLRPVCRIGISSQRTNFLQPAVCESTARAVA